MDIARVFNESTPLLLKGMLVTAQVTVISLFIAFFLGLFTSLLGRSAIKPLTWVAKGYIWIIRGTPLLVQVFFIYFGLPQMMQAIGFSDFRLTAYVASIISLSLNAGAYIAEIFRGGIQAVDPGQVEAARSLGLSKFRTMIRVVLPQALRISIPSLVNQMIITLKDTSIVSIISLAEIVYQAKIYIGTTMQSFGTWTLVGAYYLVLVTLLTFVSNYVEKRLDYGKKS